jgi:SAM-dependent methyltransferase
MERLRSPLQGVTNIVRFNWHFYVLAAGFASALFVVSRYSSDTYRPFILLGLAGLIVTVLLSLLVSLYVYDLSGLYSLSWLDFIPAHRPLTLVNIHAGFDETSALLQAKFPLANLHVFDFYDPALHTEISIQRARKAYPPYPETQAILTTTVPLPEQSTDFVFLILAAHEIRSETERVRFFDELTRILRPTGQIIVVEHLRDGANFFAYNIGFLHFLSRKTWLRTFAQANLRVVQTFRLTPFINTFILQVDVASS